MDLGLRGKVALVTGGSKGIGRGIAETLIGEGCHVAICARGAELQQATAELAKQAMVGARATGVHADMTVDADRQALVEGTLREFGAVDILVNNAAAVGAARTIDGAPVEEWRKTFELNVFAAVHMVQLVLPGMRERGWGRIINISSENGTQPYPDMIAYSASKGALDNLSKALSKQCAQEGILVNTVSPAFIETPAVDAVMERLAGEAGVSKQEVIRKFLAERRPHIALARPGRIEEVGPLVALLASDKASFINGANLRIDGGSVASV
jgi:NAD(P)-dependent dehydrogenase (short-subunit alcohol dehydrogenase family)